MAVDHIFAITGGDGCHIPLLNAPKQRRKIIDSARRLFNRHGFESVSITQIMAGAGLTHGGFYSYFKSKRAIATLRY